MKFTASPSALASLAAAATLSIAGTAAAQPADAMQTASPVYGTEAAPPADFGGFGDSLNAAREIVARIANDGVWDVYVSGRAWHGRNSYTKQERDRFNEHAWGLGFGKTLRDSRGIEQSLFALGLKDSNSRPQWAAGYLRQWIWPVADAGVEFGLGFSAMMMSRKDVFDRVPFPMAAPIASVGTRRVKLMATWVPPFARKGIGDVLLLFGRISFD